MGHRIPNYGEVGKGMDSDKPQEPGQATPISTSTESNPRQSEESPPSGDQANLHFYSLIEQYNASQRHNEIREQKRDAIDRQRLRVEKAAIWVGVAGILGLLFNLCETRRAVDVAIENARLDQRAWVGVSGITLVDQARAGGRLEFLVNAKNTGEIPALKVIFRIRVHVMLPETLESLQSLIANAVPSGRYVIPPGENHDVSFYVPGEMITEQLAVGINEGSIPVYLFGLITYEDIFKTPDFTHETQFCAVYQHDKSRPQALQSCGKEDYDYMK